MLKFIIIDSDLNWQQRIEKIIAQMSFEFEKVVVETYDSYNDNLEKTMKDNSYHKVYIIEIDLVSKISGLHIAKNIRNDDHESHIIILTNHDNMFEEVHRSIYEIFVFIEKFHNANDRLVKAIKTIVEVGFDKGIFRYSTRSIDLQIFYKEILYFERDTLERKVVIHTKQGNFIVAMPIEKILMRLDSRFRQVHRSCIVNDEEVTIYNWTKGEFTLTSRVTIPLLSKKFRRKDEDDFVIREKDTIV